MMSGGSFTYETFQIVPITAHNGNTVYVIPSNATATPSNAMDVPSNAMEVPSNAMVVPSNAKVIPSNAIEITCNAMGVLSKATEVHVPSTSKETSSDAIQTQCNAKDASSEIKEEPTDAMDVLVPSDHAVQRLNLHRLDFCCNCECEIDFRKRVTAQIKNRDFSSEAALESLGIDLMPGRDAENSICPSCSKALGKLSCSYIAFNETLSEMKKVAKPHSYMGYRIRRFSETQCPPKKRRKLTNSSLKKDKSTQTRKTPTSTPMFTPPPAPMPVPKKRAVRSCSFLGQAAKDLESARYDRMLRTMQKSEAFTTKIFDSVCRTIRGEMKKSASTFTAGPGNRLKSYQNFSFKAAYRDCKRQCPTLMRALESTLGRSPTKQDEVRLTTVMAFLNFARYVGQTTKPKILQELISLLLWFGGLSTRTYRRLNRLGICVDLNDTNKLVKCIKAEYDASAQHRKKLLTDHKMARRELYQSADWEDVTEWEEVPAATETPPAEGSLGQDDDPTTTAPSPMDDSEMQKDDGVDGVPAATETPPAEGSLGQDDDPTTSASSPMDDSEMQKDDGVDGDGSTDDSTEAPQFGFTLAFDIVHPTTRPRANSNFGRDKKQLSLIQAYGAIDRVPCLNLSDEAPSAEELANIPIDIFLTTSRDIKELKNEYRVMISRIVRKHFHFFNHMDVTEHIKHPHLAETKKKSIMVPLGVPMEKDEGMIDIIDMIDVVDHLQKFVPGKESLTPVVLYGDQLSCERVRDAIEACCYEDTPQGRLQGIHPSVQEWHKQLLLLEDTYALLYDAQSVKSCGSLSYIRRRYNLTDVTPEVSRCFNDATDLLRFATEAHVIAAACECMGISKPSDLPRKLPENQKDRAVYFKKTCKSVLEMSFHPYQPGESTGPFCICRQNKEDEEMVFCDNKICDRGQWFHLSCMKIQPDHLPKGKWFCSDKCLWEHQQGKKKSDGPTDLDSKFEYSKALLHYGLGEMVYQDAIQEGDGHRMIQHWRLDMFHFFEKCHWKYLTEAHHLIMDVNGGVSPRLAHQLMWNRTVNTHGKKGNNASMDLGLEGLNKVQQESIRFSTGHLTQGFKALTSQSIGIKDTLQSIFDTTKPGRVSNSTDRDDQIRGDDLAMLAELLVKEKCLVNIAGRSHEGFEGFYFDHRFAEMNEYKAKMADLCKKRVEQAKAAALGE